MPGELIVGMAGQRHVVRYDDGMCLLFPQPTPPISINQVAGRSRHGWRGRVDAWKAAVETLARDAIRTDPELTRSYMEQGAAWSEITVRLSWQVATSRGRDPHNYSSTMVKAVVDGLVRAHVVPDDTDAYVATVDSVIHRIGKVRHAEQGDRLWAWVDVIRGRAIDPIGRSIPGHRVLGQA